VYSAIAIAPSDMLLIGPLAHSDPPVLNWTIPSVLVSANAANAAFKVVLEVTLMEAKA
jgi:hypothetical protein